MELRLRVVALALEPAMVLARAMTLSLDDVENLTRTAYFREYRERGLSLSQIAKRLRKSPRTTAELAKEAQEETASSLLVRSERLLIRRQILRCLHRGPRSETQLRQALARFPKTAVDEELLYLIEQKILDTDVHGVTVHGTMVDLTDDASEKRFASARHFMNVVTQTLFSRFFSNTRAQQSFARAVTFLARESDIAELGPNQFSNFVAQISDIDARAQGHADALEAHALLAVVPSPQDMLFRSRDSE